MWKGPDLVMRACVQTMGEEIVIESGSLPFTARGIFELVTNYDETEGLVDVENFDAVVDFRKTDLTTFPRPKDRVTVPSIGKSYLIISVMDDYFGRFRCNLLDE